PEVRRVSGRDKRRQALHGAPGGEERSRGGVEDGGGQGGAHPGGEGSVAGAAADIADAGTAVARPDDRAGRRPARVPRLAQVKGITDLLRSWGSAPGKKGRAAPGRSRTLRAAASVGRREFRSVSPRSTRMGEAPWTSARARRSGEARLPRPGTLARPTTTRKVSVPRRC